MFISHRYRVIFVHIQRTGGYSIHNIFQEYDPDLVEIIPVPEEKKRLRHCHISDIKESIDSDIFNNYRKFCVVRHPYYRMLSWFQVLHNGYDRVNEPHLKVDNPILKIYQQGISLLSNNPNWYKEKLAKSWNTFFALLLSVNKEDSKGKIVLRGEQVGSQVIIEINRCASNFAEFLNLPREAKHGLFERFYTNQLDYISINSNVVVDNILRFENLQSDFFQFSQSINFPGSLPHLNCSQQDSSAKINQKVTNNIREIILNRFQRDFEFFSYTPDF